MQIVHVKIFSILAYVLEHSKHFEISVKFSIGKSKIFFNKRKKGPVPSKDMQIVQLSPSSEGGEGTLRIFYLDIKDAQCAETKNVLKKSYRVFELWASKRSKKMRKKFNFLQKYPNLQERSELI